MKIITIATQKGGAGKTTFATNLAVASANKGYTTLIIDADPDQKTALEWFNKREDKENPVCIAAPDKNTLEKLLTKAREMAVERVFIDTHGGVTNLVNAAISEADFCLLPCRSSGFDIGAQRRTASTVTTLEKSAAFIISQAPSRGQEANETRSILEGLGVHISKLQTTSLKAYKDAALFSSSVIEDDKKKGKAGKEIMDLFSWIERQLESNPLLDGLKEVVHAD